jgi:hypothetical protein
MQNTNEGEFTFPSQKCKAKNLTEFNCRQYQSDTTALRRSEFKVSVCYFHKQ